MNAGLYRMAWYATAICMALLSTGCSKSEQDDPLGEISITAVEIGSNNSKTGYSGGDLHVEAQVDASAGIKDLKLQIVRQSSGYGWVLDKSFKEAYAGRKSALFHEHFDIPEDATAGAYQVLILVDDINGQRGTYKDVFNLVKDPLLPTIGSPGLDAGSGQLRIKANINAPNALAGLAIEVQSSAWTRKFEYTDADIVGSTRYNLDKVIDISSAPAGHYHITVTATDKIGKSISYTFHLDR